MDIVKLQKEDAHNNLEVHLDTEGNKYDFAFGLNWQGVIADLRTGKYKQ